MYRFGVIGDDLRMKYLYDALISDGYSAKMGAQYIDECEIILLPVNSAELAKCGGKTVIGGFTGVIPAPQDCRIINYLTHPHYIVKNAQLTAEGAIFMAMQLSHDALMGKSALITGFGNIAKALCRRLISFGADVTVCARNAGARAEAEDYGAWVCDFSALALNPADFVFNTVPSRVISYSYLSVVSPESVVIELASAPGGIDASAAHTLGITLVDGRGLPGKYAPRTAGQILHDTVTELAREV